MPRIGVLSAATASEGTDAALLEGLAALGYVEKRSIAIEWRHANGRVDRLPALAAELVGLGVEVIVALGTPVSRAAKEATSAIPIVMAFASDPATTGLVASLARPGGNVTGLATIVPVLVAKRLQLLQETLPGITRVGVLWVSGEPDRAQEFLEVQNAAGALGLSVRSLEARNPGDPAGLIAAASGANVEALFVLDHALFNVQREQIVALAARLRLPVVSLRREFVEVGGLMSYGPDLVEMCRQSATYVDKLLRGAKPAELPVEQPSRFDFVINLGTTRELGLTIPQSVLIQATEVIQ